MRYLLRLRVRSAFGVQVGVEVEVVIDVVVVAEVKVEVEVQVEVPYIPSSTLRLMFLSGLCSMRRMKSSVLCNNSYFRVIDTPNEFEFV